MKEKEKRTIVNQKEKEKEATHTQRMRDIHTVILKPPPVGSKQKKLHQKPLFKVSRKKANPQPSSAMLNNKISNYFKPIDSESERFAAKGDLGQELEIIATNQDLHETRRPVGQAEMNQDRGGQT